ncbi:MAG TPA: phasin family protein [Paenalcaligenes sp.]|nr:phasin family protein [Paenalcaligenes sp.]
MSISTEQFLAKQKDSIDNLVAAQTRLFSGFEQLVNLNMELFKASIDEVSEKTQQAASLKDVQEATAFTSELSQPTVEKAVDYGKNVFEIVSKLQSDIAEMAEKQLNLNQQQAAEWVDQLAKSAPAGSEGAIALLKSSVVSYGNLADNAFKAMRQAAELNEANVNAATGAVIKTAEQAAEVVEQNISRTTGAANKAAKAAKTSK